MNRTQLEYFVSVAQLRSFTKAAEKHFVSQTAVTQQIQNLEESLHTVLFDRKQRPVKLTEEGTVFLNEAKAILERMNAAVSKLSVVSNSLSGSLRIGYTKGYERSDLSNILKKYHQDYPNVFITCHRCNSLQLAQGLLSDEFDIIFTWDRDPVMTLSNVASQKVEKTSLDAVLYPAHPFVHRMHLKREELKEETFLYLTPSNTMNDESYLKLYHDAGYEPNISFYTDDIESILMMIAAEEGISIMPSYITRKLNNAEGIVYVHMEGEEETAGIIAAWKKDLSKKSLEQFIHYLPTVYENMEHG